MDAATFRADFPEFADLAKFPDGSVNFWLTLAGKLLRPDRWADVLDQGLELFVAHNLALAAFANPSKVGAIGGVFSGMVSAKTVDKLSVTYDTTVGLDPKAGVWNLTTYGRLFYTLMQMAGMGGTQLGGPPALQVFPIGGVFGGPLGPGWPYAY